MVPSKILHTFPRKMHSLHISLMLVCFFRSPYYCFQLCFKWSLFLCSDACDLTLDANTVNTHLILSEKNKRVTYMEEKQTYPDHPERFDGFEQVLCRESLTGRCYWEVKWRSWVDVAVTYKGINRNSGSNCWFGYNDKSWTLYCINDRYTVCHNNKSTDISSPSSSNRVGVYLDWPAGTVSFYSVTDTHTFTHLHTFDTTFTEPLYAGFGVYNGSSVSLYQIEQQAHTTD